VRLAEAEPGAVDCERDGDLLAAPPALNPTLRLAQYRWPVHEVSPKYQPEQPLEQALFLTTWRKRDDRTGFMKLNAVTARLIELADQRAGATGKALLEQIAEELQAPDPAPIVKSGQTMLERLREREIILGTRG